MNRDRAFLADKLSRIHDPHIAPLNGPVEAWHAQGMQVPWADPDSGGIHSRILFLHESPGPAASGQHGSGIISPDNNDQTAARFWRLSRDAGLARNAYINWNIGHGMSQLPALTSTRVPLTATPRCRTCISSSRC